MEQSAIASVVRGITDRNITQIVIAHLIKVEVVAPVALNVVQHDHVEWIQVQVDDAFRVDLVQAQQEIPRNDLDIAQVEGLAPIEEVFKEVGWAGWQLELLLQLDLLDDPVRFLHPLLLDLGHERFAHHVRRLFRDEVEHVR